MKESLHEIGKAIQRHIEKEKASYMRIPAIGRAFFSLEAHYAVKRVLNSFGL